MDLQKLNTLDQIKTTVESMDKYHQIEILRILTKKLSKISENKSGSYVNLSLLPDETISEIKEYIFYIQQQEDSINTMEYQKEEFKSAFFIEKEDKDNKTVLYSAINNNKV
jgi:hypothetical protein